MRKRLIIVGVAIFALFSLLIIQFYRVQVVQHDKWQSKAISQHEGKIRLPFKRGIFYSTDHKPLVVDLPKYHLHIDPASIPIEWRDDIAAKLESVTGKSDLRAEFDRKSRNRQLVRWCEREVHEEITNWWHPYSRQRKIARNALFFVKDYQRSYPYGKMLGQVLHTIRDHKDEETKQGVPTGGLEARYDSLLQGKEGLKWMIHSPRHRLAMGDVIYPAEDGADITLTIDHSLQAIAEEEIELGVKRVGAKGGWIVIMQPYTGEILAIAQYPFFDPQRYRDYFNDEEQASQTLVKGVTYAYEPGSTIKPLIMALCLKANQEADHPFFDPEAKVDCNNGKVPGRKTPLKDVRQHGYLNMDMGLQRSSNVYPGKAVQQVVEHMGTKWLESNLRETYGFGKPTRIQLPGETYGFVPTPGKTYASGALEWSGPTPYSLAMGYNMLANSIQMTRAWSVLANGGYLVQPTLIKRIEKGGDTVFDLSQLPPPKRVLDRDIVDRVVHSLKFVTKKQGSSPFADIPGYSEVGKSGTAEKLESGKYNKNLHFSSFIGFAPADQPAVVILVAIDEMEKMYIPGLGSTQYGGHCAAPIFGQVGKRALAHLGVVEDDPYGFPRDHPRADEEKAHWVKEVAALREIYDSWNTPQR